MLPDVPTTAEERLDGDRRPPLLGFRQLRAKRAVAAAQVAFAPVERSERLAALPRWSTSSTTRATRQTWPSTVYARSSCSSMRAPRPGSAPTGQSCCWRAGSLALGQDVDRRGSGPRRQGGPPPSPGPLSGTGGDRCATRTGYNRRGVRLGGIDQLYAALESQSDPGVAAKVI
jgi:hypothetical protein